MQLKVYGSSKYCFGNRLISRLGDIMWPSRSLNLSVYYFFTMGLVETQSGSDQAKKPK